VGPDHRLDGRAADLFPPEGLALTDARLETLDGPATRRLAADLRAIYLAALAQPPFGEGEEQADAFAAELADEVEETGFRSCAALVGGAPVGFAYGCPAFAGEPEDEWTRELVDSVGPEVTEGWIRAQFAFIWTAVRPEWQGRGLGGRLHDELLSTAAEPRAWLVTYPFDCPAVRLYRRRGWVELGRGPLGMGSAERIVMGLELSV
jgi:GNAT superfamily N-acetyltransferase